VTDGDPFAGIDVGDLGHVFNRVDLEHAQSTRIRRGERKKYIEKLKEAAGHTIDTLEKRGETEMLESLRLALKGMLQVKEADDG
jgi:hypothetical protein